ncbi:Glycerate kinase [Alteracholeplasma palmae J233]|uniref:Glycerate kinase n=2 Tax=Acholeplasma palmae TaxID=38986 RepID=U4KNU7_ALTPJ|nr:glycerate kinase [Alteracholeplasma palmae]CCV63885.1 Glycerate kinase [Alteracholeplasma palmae J233]
MKIVIAPDSFKGSLTAKQVSQSIQKGFKQVFPDAKYVLVPMADGGEGTVQSLVDATNGKLKELEVVGPLGNKVKAKYGILGDGITGVIEMAEASGIGYVNKDTKNPLITTTYGTGELIKACIDSGVKKIIIGIGGSATNDGGAGMAEALGVKFLDSKGKDIPRGGGGLSQLAKIDISGVDPKVYQTEIIIASDVTNPLCGKTGASYVFGPQKGATPEMILTLDANLRHYADLIKKQLGKDVADVPGTGAAGGLGAGLLVFTNSKMQKGIDIVVDYVKLVNELKDADLCITGEGGIDYQTQYGKAPFGVAQAAKKANPKLPVVAIAGTLGKDIEALYEKGFDAIFGTIEEVAQLEDIIAKAEESLVRTSINVARALKIKL